MMIDLILCVDHNLIVVVVDIDYGLIEEDKVNLMVLVLDDIDYDYYYDDMIVVVVVVVDDDDLIDDANENGINTIRRPNTATLTSTLSTMLKEGEKSVSN